MTAITIIISITFFIIFMIFTIDDWNTIHNNVKLEFLTFDGVTMVFLPICLLFSLGPDNWRESDIFLVRFFSAILGIYTIIRVILYLICFLCEMFVYYILKLKTKYWDEQLYQTNSFNIVQDEVEIEKITCKSYTNSNFYTTYPLEIYFKNNTDKIINKIYISFTLVSNHIIKEYQEITHVKDICVKSTYYRYLLPLNDIVCSPKIGEILNIKLDRVEFINKTEYTPIINKTFKIKPDCYK